MNEQNLINFAKQNPTEYAEKAAKANKENKGLKIIDGKLELVDFTISLEETKANKIAEINTVYENKANLVQSATPKSEVLTWDIQKIEAETYKNDNSCLTPFIDGLAVSRNIDKEVLVKKILEKVALYNSYMSFITGERQRYEDAVNASVSIDEVLKIIWE